MTPMSPGSREVRWVPPQQARGRASMNRMLEAAQALLEEVHFDEVSVQDVVREAGTSVGSFYSRFRSKDGLLQCLRERYEAERREAVEALLADPELAGADLAARARALLGLLARHDRERRGLFRTVRLRQLLGQEVPDEAALAEHDRMCRACYAFLLVRGDEIAHPQPERAVRVAFVSALLALEQKLLFGHTALAHQLPAEEERLVAELVRQVLGLLGDPGVRAGGNGVSGA
jgi:AcrR family transcriptional regulator